jgi:hypothetical protein
MTGRRDQDRAMSGMKRPYRRSSRMKEKYDYRLTESVTRAPLKRRRCVPVFESVSRGSEEILSESADAQIAKDP